MILTEMAGQTFTWPMTTSPPITCTSTMATELRSPQGHGRTDLFFGGAADQPSEIYLQKSNGTFSKSPDQLPALHAGYEDVSAIFFDADGDGDDDLYVGSGGNAAEPGAAVYQDRLYLNDKGKFATTPMPRIPTSTGAVATIDYDADGDLDLLIGGRSFPGAYPSAPRSYLLRNDAAKFTDVTAEVIPALANIGMVTAIAVGNIEGDDRPEIVVAGEWMPVTIFTGGADGFTAAPSLSADYSGIWHSLLLRNAVQITYAF
ncbi:MAG: hypothetical protein ACI81P_002498 [Neolewinella sp.]|jgi:hypothetical protein